MKIESDEQFEIYYEEMCQLAVTEEGTLPPDKAARLEELVEAVESYDKKTPG